MTASSRHECQLEETSGLGSGPLAPQLALSGCNSEEMYRLLARRMSCGGRKDGEEEDEKNEVKTIS